MSEELKPEIPEPEKIPEKKPEATKSPSAEREPTEKITNEKELSREQKTAVKKLKDYSREAKKRAKQSDHEKDDTDNERDDSDRREENKEPKTSINTLIAFGSLLVGLAGLYFIHKKYLMDQIKAGKHDDVIKIQPKPTNPDPPTQKKNPKFRTL